MCGSLLGAKHNFQIILYYQSPFWTLALRTKKLIVCQYRGIHSLTRPFLLEYQSSFTSHSLQVIYKNKIEHLHSKICNLDNFT